MTADQRIQFTGHVSADGTITLPTRLRADVAKLFSGRDITVTFERKKKKRSLNQNAYYWGCLIQMIREAVIELGDNGATPEQVHDLLKRRFLNVQLINHDTAQLIGEYTRSTTDLSTVEFCLYVDDCIQFAAEYLSIVIPLPESKRDEYVFPEYQYKKESRPEYLERIAGYLAEVFDRAQLKRYFAQNPEWGSDDEIRTLFNIRHMELKEVK